MRKIAAAIIAALLAVALHAAAMGLWHEGHATPFHAGKAMLTCPIGYVCPVSPEALRAALTAPGPEGFKTLTTIFLVLAALLCADLIERARYRPPAIVATPDSPSGLRSIFKKE